MKSNIFKDYLFITIGVFLLHIGFYFFLQPIQMVIGGMMGLSILLEPVIPLSVGTIYLILNIVSLIVGLLVFGKTFFIRTFYAALLAPLLTTLFEILEIPSDLFINSDMVSPHNQLLISALASGALIGIGMGLVLRHNATTGGIDVYQKMINKYLKVPFTVAMYLTDGLLVLIGMVFNFEVGMFAIISIVITTILLEKVAIFGRSAYAILIITDHGERVKDEIFRRTERGVTKAKVVGGYTGKDKEMIITTVIRQELYHIKDLVLEVDPKAFTLILHTKEVLGEGFHRDELT